MVQWHGHGDDGDGPQIDDMIEPEFASRRGVESKISSQLTLDDPILPPKEIGITSSPNRYSETSPRGTYPEINAQRTFDSIMAETPDAMPQLPRAESSKEGASRSGTESYKTAEDIASLTAIPRDFGLSSYQLQFKKGWRGHWAPERSRRLRNDLLAIVGLLELANSLDFAANVWNMVPPPIYAKVLMGVGGSIAVIIALSSVWDAVLTLRNIQFLRGERAELLSIKLEEEKAQTICSEQSISVRLEINRRELGQEIIDRFSMDSLMGLSALIVGIGTIMAIGGSNPRVYDASNLLSGYIGNGISALWATSNFLWCAYLYRRAGRHFRLGSQELKDGVVKDRMKKRTAWIQLHAALMASATLLSAPGGMLAVTHWWAYFILLPCVILAKWGNVVFKKHLGYDRVRLAEIGVEGIEALQDELSWTIDLEATLSKKKKKSGADLSRVLGGNLSSSEEAKHFMLRCGLGEPYFCQLLNNSVLTTDKKSFDVDMAMVLDKEDSNSSVISIAEEVLQRHGRRALKYKERFLIELLGASFYDVAAYATKPAVTRDETSHRIAISMPPKSPQHSQEAE